MKISVNDFLIASKTKSLFAKINIISINMSKKDSYLKNVINNSCNELLKNIYLENFDYTNNLNYFMQIKTNISLIDFYLELTFKKKYIGEKDLEKLSGHLLEINKMVTKWHQNRIINVK